METPSLCFMCPGKWLCTGQSANSLCPQSSQSPRRQSHTDGCLRLKEALADPQSILAPFILLRKAAPSALLGSKIQKHYIPPAPSVGPISPPIPRCSCNFKCSFCFSIKQNLLGILMYANTCSYGSQHTGSTNNKMLISNWSSTISTLNSHGLKLCS